MLKKSCSIFLRVLCVLYLSLALNLQAAPEDRTPESLHAELTRLHQELEEHASHFAHEDALSPLEEQEISQLWQRWQQMEARAAALGSDGKDLLRKANRLEPLLRNLERARTQTAAPPAPPRPTVLRQSAESMAAEACADAPPIVGDTVAGTTVGATNDGHATCGSSYFSADVWYRYTATESGTVSIDTLGANFDAVLSVHAGCPGTTANELTCDDDSFGLDAVVSFYAQEGETYWIRVSGFDGTAGDFELHVGSGGTITGRVTDQESGLPLSDGTLSVRDENHYSILSTSPAADGTYEFTVPAGNYSMETLNFAGHLQEVWNDKVCFPSSCFSTAGDPIQVPVNQVTTDIDFALEGGATLSGTVILASDGTPLSGAYVRIHDEENRFLKSASTMADGTWSASGLHGGTYFAYVQYSPYLSQIYDGLNCGTGSCDPTVGTPITLPSGDTATGIHFALETGARITGTLRDATTGDPLSGISMRLRASDNSLYRSTSTDASGAYVFDGLFIGNYLLETSTDLFQNEVWDDIPCTLPSNYCNDSLGTPIQLPTDSFIASGIDFDLVRLGTLSGTVTDATTGDPLSGVEIDAYGGYGYFEGHTDSNGYYEISGLPPGDYFVKTDLYDSMYLNELYDDLPCYANCLIESGTPLSVTLANETTGIDFALDRGGSIGGTLTATATGLPTPFESVRLYNPQGNSIEREFTDSEGNYLFEGLPPGDYHLVTETYGDYADELYDDLPCSFGCDVSDGMVLTLSFGTELTGIDFSLEETGSISGSVTDAQTGLSLPNDLYIELYDAGGNFLFDDYVYSNGLYEFSDLPPGDYYLRTRLFNNDYANELYEDIPCTPTCDVLSGTPVRVAAGADVTEIDFALGDYPGTIEGTVVSALGGLPLVGISVGAYRSDDQRIASAFTDATGTYRLENLLPGTYAIRTENSPGIVDELYDNIPCDPDCSNAAGDWVSVTETTVMGIDFELGRMGGFGGTVTDSITGAAIDEIDVELWSSTGILLRSVETGPSGEYHFDVEPGTYFVTASQYFDYYDGSYAGQLWPGLACPLGPSGGCDVTTGSPIVVGPSIFVDGIDFALDPPGRLSGRLIDAVTGSPVDGEVEFWSANGQYLGDDYVYSDGVFNSRFLPAGIVYVSTETSANYLDEAFDGIPCFGGAPSGCDPTKGTPVRVVPNTTTRHINFSLVPLSDGEGDGGYNLIVRVVDEVGNPLPDVAIDFWGMSGEFDHTRFTNSSGETYNNLYSWQTFYLSTGNGDDFIDQVWDGVLCPAGSAYQGLCDVTLGTPVSGAIPGPQILEFRLTSTLPLFSDGFESGDHSTWSVAVGMSP